MHKLRTVVSALTLIVCLDKAEAGGFRFDATNCPQGEWFPDVHIPQTVTDTVCKFFLALDNDDFSSAYGLSSSEFTQGRSIQEFVGSIQGTFEPETVIARQPQLRNVTNVMQEKDIYIFTFQILSTRSFSGNGYGFQESVYVKTDSDGPKIAGVSIGPY